MYPVLSANTPAATGYNLTKSLRFRSSASAYLNRTPASATNRQIYTWSGWVKRGTLGSAGSLFDTGTFTNGNQLTTILFTNSDTLMFTAGIYGTSTEFATQTTQVFRDPSAWYHIVVALDTTQATNTNRVKIYVNGVQVTAFTQLASYSIYPSQNYSTAINLTNSHRIGNQPIGEQFDGYMAEVNFIDGQQLTPSSFGSTNSTTGVWQPAKYTGTYGTNGFYLPFTNTTSTTTLGNDSSGNGNNWTTNNFSLTTGSTYDSMTDVPTLTSATTANYCVLNPLIKPSVVSISDGNLTGSIVSGTYNGFANFYVNSGKWYWEVTANTNSSQMAYGISPNPTFTTVFYSETNGVYYYGNGNKYVNTTSSAYGSSFTSGDVIGFALDVSANTLTCYKNNVSQGSITIPSGQTWTPSFGSGNGGITMTGYYNFGQQGFIYTPPTSFKALNTYNLPDSTIVAGNKVMDATTWTGTGSNPITITNTASFKPDLVWGKVRSQAYNNQLYDSVRGTGKSISSNSTGQTITNETDGYITAFNSNGFTAGAGATSNNYWNQNTQTYVAWQWQAGQGTTSSNTNGSITSTVSVNATAGFSVVQYVGTGANATVGHGLGVAPSMVIVKSLTRTDNWIVYHSGMTSASYYMYLNQTNAQAIGTTVWNSTAPTSSVFSLGIDTTANSNGATQIAYCWSEIAGFSKFGNYTGNGSTDGTFVYTGFRPRYIMFKRSDTGGAGFDWYIVDTVRNTYNAAGTSLWADLSDAEVSATFIDILSNGFKFRGTSTGFNGSGATYIYAAFAENPFKNSLAR